MPMSFKLRVSTISSAVALSPWEAYKSASTMPNGPWLTRSTCADAEYRGIVFYYHGFSAVSSQIEDLAPGLNSACFDLLAPTLPGHGEAAIQDCKAKGAHCSVRFAWDNKTKGFDLREVPVNSSSYLSFVKDMNGILMQEFDHRAQALGKQQQDLSLVSLGLSFGGALAAYATWLEPAFTHQLLINPFFGYGDGMVDSRFRLAPPARNAEARLMRVGIDGISLASDYLHTSGNNTSAGLEFVHEVVEETMDGVRGWWGDCDNIFNSDRHGFCAYKNEHVAAVSSAGMHILSKLLAENTSRVTTQALLTERDGLIRNGFTYQLLRHLQNENANAKGRVGMCMYRFPEGVNRSNVTEYLSSANCIPHASLDRFDYDELADIWWRYGLFKRITSFVLSDSPLKESLEWQGTRDECVGVPLEVNAFREHPWLRQALLPAAAPLPDKSGDSSSTPNWQEMMTLFAVNELGPKACDSPSAKAFLRKHGLNCKHILSRIAADQQHRQMESFVV